jgi:hypothetical protein
MRADTPTHYWVLSRGMKKYVDCFKIRAGYNVSSELDRTKTDTLTYIQHLRYVNDSLVRLPV